MEIEKDLLEKVKSENQEFKKLFDEKGVDAFKFRVGSECGRGVDEWAGMVPKYQGETGKSTVIVDKANQGYFACYFI